MSPDHWAVSTGLVAISALALIANALLLLVFFRRRGLRTVSNRFVINLLVTNLLSSVVLIPLLLVDQKLQPPASTNLPSGHLILRDTNSSSRLVIENIQIHDAELEQFEEYLSKMETFGNTIARLEKEEIRSNIEETFPKIRHLEHFLRTRNISQEEGLNLTLSGNKTDDVSISFLCYLSGGSTSLVCTASILSILLIAIDQYFAVTKPLRYHTFIDKFKSLVLLVSTWLVSLVFGVLGAFVDADSSVWNFCARFNKDSNFQYGYNVFFAFTYLFLVILVPFIVICVMYGCIYCAAHQNSERMRKSNSGSSNTNLDVYIQIPLDNKLKVKVNSSDNVNIQKDYPKLPKVKSAPNFANFERTKINCHFELNKVCHANSLRSNASFINSLRTKISNASLFKYREETRAAKISVLVIFMVLVCYLPFGLALVLNSGLVGGKIGAYLGSVALSLLVTATLLSPFLFAYRNRRIRRELRRVLGLIPRKDHTHGTSVYKAREMKELSAREPFLPQVHQPPGPVPEVIVTCKSENEKKSILKRVCSKGKTWGAGKRCNFISVPECLSAECRCSFSSASTQVSSEDYSIGN